jgi:hypothetical protein
MPNSHRNLIQLGFPEVSCGDFADSASLQQQSSAAFAACGNVPVNQNLDWERCRGSGYGDTCEGVCKCECCLLT